MAEGADEHALLLQISYDLARLQKQSNSAQGIVNKGLTDIERRAAKTAAVLEESFALKGLNLKNVESGLGSIINSGRLGLLDAATAKVGAFGGALEGLGASGLIAAGGIAAVGFALDQAQKAGEWALQLEHVSNALGITTTRTQQFDLVWAATGTDIDKGREAISGLNRTIGLVESGLARAQSTKAFTDGLKITPEQLRGWGTLDQQLPHILDAAAKLNVQERAGLASRMKIDPEVLNSLIEFRDRIPEVTKAGADLGVMSADDVDKLAAVQKQLKANSQIIDGEFRQSFVNAQGPILALQGLLGRFASGLLRVEDGFHRFAYNVSLDAAYISGHLQSFYDGGKTDPNAAVQGVYNAAHAPTGSNPSSRNDTYTPPTNLAGPPKVKRGKSGAGALAASNNDLDAADKALADAQKALATSFDARAKFESDALTAEETKESQKLAADLKASKTAGERDAIGKAQTEQAQAFALRRQLIANQLSAQLAEQATAIQTLTLQGQQDMLRAQDALGGTTAQHAAVALKIFELDQQIAAAKLQETIDSKTASDAEKARAALELANLNATAPDRRQAVVNAGQISASQASADIRAQALQSQIDQLDAEKGVYQTTEKRRQIALQLFALDEQLQEAKLKEQIAEAQIAGNTEKQALLQSQLSTLQSTAGQRGQAVSDANPGNSWAAWVADAKSSTADVAESFAKMKVDGVEAFNDSLFDSEGRLNNFGTIARKVSAQFITDAEKWGVKSLEAGIFGGGAAQDGQGKAANPLQSIGGSIGKLFGLGGSAGGGVTQPAGTSADPIYVAFTSGAPGSSGLSSLFGGGSSDAGGGLSSLFSGLFGKGGGASGGGGLASLFGGAGGGAGGLGSIFSAIGSFLPGFAGGGSMTVGGRGGVDKNLAMMKVSRDERITIETPQQQRDRAAGGIGAVHQTFNFPGANPDGFRRSARQWSRQSRMAMQYAGG